MSTGAYLDAYLASLAPWLDRPDVTDIYVNRPGVVWVEALGGRTERHAAPNLTDVTLWRLATQIAAATHQGVSREHPLLSAVLPGGARVQIVAPPATRGGLALAIRKQVVQDLRIDDYVTTGAFDTAAVLDGDPPDPADAALDALLAQRDIGGS